MILLVRLGGLKLLRTLSLQWNHLHGEVPKEFGGLPDLRNLMLESNFFEGEIPKELGEMKSLEYLSLGRNRLRGPIHKELGQLPKLTILNLRENQLSGEIPKELGELKAPWKLRRLQVLEVFGRPTLFHPCGAYFAFLPSLQALMVCPLEDLKALLLYRNQLSGEIPRELGALGDLQFLQLYQNHLTGEIPRELGELENLEGQESVSLLNWFRMRVLVVFMARYLTYARRAF